VVVLRWVPGWLKELVGGGSSAKAADYRRRRDVYLSKLNGDLEKRLEEGWEGKCIQANVMRDPEAKLNEEELRSISLTM
jgi:hypothetical protein